MKNLAPDIWFPHFWFFLYTVAHSYPDLPNAVTKRKYYDFIQNLPLFCPHVETQKIFVRILDSFPITPYLDNKDSFTYWVHTIQNKMDNEYGLAQKTLVKHLDIYYDHYLPKSYAIQQKNGLAKRNVVLLCIAVSAIIIICLGRKCI